MVATLVKVNMKYSEKQRFDGHYFSIIRNKFILWFYFVTILKKDWNSSLKPDFAINRFLTGFILSCTGIEISRWGKLDHLEGIKKHL